jgi:hypothetical protein
MHQTINPPHSTQDRIRQTNQDRHSVDSTRGRNFYINTRRHTCRPRLPTRWVGSLVGIRHLLKTVDSEIKFLDNQPPQTYRYRQDDMYIMDLFRSHGISISNLRDVGSIYKLCVFPTLPMYAQCPSDLSSDCDGCHQKFSI